MSMFLSPTFNNYQLMAHCISTKLPPFPLPQFKEVPHTMPILLINISEIFFKLKF